MQQEGKLISALLLETYLSDKVTSASAALATNAVIFAVPMQGFTFLMISASKAHLSVAKELPTATAGANVDAVNKQVGFSGQLTKCQPQHEQTIRLETCSQRSLVFNPIDSVTI